MSSFELKAPAGANRNKKVLGRGHGAGTGKTAGKGHKGTEGPGQAETSDPGFEGGTDASLSPCCGKRVLKPPLQEKCSYL